MGLSAHKAGPIKSCWTAYDKLSGGEVKMGVRAAGVLGLEGEDEIG